MRKNNFGIIAIVVLSFLPVIFWALMKPLALRFANIAITLTSLGQLTALVGTTMFAIDLILSGRFRFLENYFGGLNRIYIVHHILGSLSFILLLFHPLFLAGKYFISSPQSAALFLLPSKEWSINFGIIALFLVILAFVFTFFIKLPYQIWKFFHKFLGSAFFFAALHSFFISSDISRNLTLRLYILGLAIIGIIIVFYRALKSKFSLNYFKYRVINITSLTENIIEITMEPINDKRINFIPGQFIFVKFIDNNISDEAHPFSIASANSETNLKLVIKGLGDYTRQLRNLKVGALAKIEGPFGRFSYQNIENKNQIWIAGGIGITPFLSMARTLKNKEYMIDFYYCVNNEKEAVFLDELSKIAQNYNLRLIPFQGLINADIIQKTSGDLSNRDIFLCGPPMMIKNLKKQFKTLKIPKKNIHSEEFQLL